MLPWALEGRAGAATLGGLVLKAVAETRVADAVERDFCAGQCPAHCDATICLAL